MQALTSALRHPMAFFRERVRGWRVAAPGAQRARHLMIVAKVPSWLDGTPGHTQLLVTGADTRRSEQAGTDIAYGHGPRSPVRVSWFTLLRRRALVVRAHEVEPGTGLVEEKAAKRFGVAIDFGSLTAAQRAALEEFLQREAAVADHPYQLIGRDADNCITIATRALASTFGIPYEAIKPLDWEWPDDHLGRIAPTLREHGIPFVMRDGTGVVRDSFGTVTLHQAPQPPELPAEHVRLRVTSFVEP